MPRVLTIAASQQRPRPSGARASVIIKHEPGTALDRHGVPVPVSTESNARYCARAPRTPDEVIGAYHVQVDGGLYRLGSWDAQQAEMMRQAQLEPEVLWNLATVVKCAPDENRVNGSGSPTNLPVTANNNGLHICFCDYSPAALEAGARIVALWTRLHGIAPQNRTAADWPTTGIYDHGEVPKPNTHTDPRNFPHAAFDMRLARILAPPAPKVLPRFNRPAPMVDRLLDEQGRVVAILFADGRVFGYGVPYDRQNPHRSQPLGNAYFAGRTAARIEWPNAKEKRAGYAYTVIATSGERYGQSAGL